jgi:tetratricopeptide (TPR) repeat protein
LETIRQYAREKLNDSGEGEAVRARHTRWCVDLAERAESRLVGHGQLEWLDRLEQEHDNIRAALEWSLNNTVELGLRIASALRHYWSLRGHAIEGFQHMERLIAAHPLGTSLLSARALTCAGWVAMFSTQEAKATALATASVNMSQELGYREGWAISLLILHYFPRYHGDADRALPLAEEGLALFRESDNKWGIRLALTAVGIIQQVKGNYEQAQSIYQESLALSREIGDVEGSGYALFLLGNLAFKQAQYEQALAFYEESLVILREVKARVTSAWVMQDIGFIAIVLGQYDRAQSLLQDCLVLCQENGYSIISGVLSGLGRVARRQSDYEQAAKFFADSMQLARKYELPGMMAWNLVSLAELAALRHQSRKAARLLGKANAIPELYIDLFAFERLELEQTASTIRDGLDEATFKNEQEVGRQMALEEAIAYALKED